MSNNQEITQGGNNVPLFKQNSVQWAIEKITMICAMYNNKEMSAETFSYYHNDIVTKAKAMHKKEIVDFAIFFSHEYANKTDILSQYNETFGGNK
jgi:hypothetical protein